MTAQLLATILVYAALGAGADARPAIHVSPTKALAGSYQHFEFTFTVGSRGMGQGGGVRIELPVAYLETGPYYWDRPQTDSTAGRGYVRAISTGNAAVDINLAGRNGGIVECVVRHGSMKPGERIALEYSGVVQSIAWKLPVRAEWRMDAQGAWQAVDNAPIISFLPQKAVTVFAVTPADIQHGAEFDLAVVLLDRYGNRATGYAGTVSFASTDVDAKLLRPYTFTVKDAGVRVFPGVQYESTGFHKVTLTDGHLAGRSNYSEVHASPPMLRRCFGDTHFHTGSGTDNSSFSTTSAGGDHRGHYTTQDSAYAYARDVMRLDFASAAEHDAKVFTGSLWEKAQAITDSFHEPDRFTTFYAYEWTASPTEGHHVILYRDRAGQVLDHFEYPTKTALYDGLRRQGVPAVMIPHAMWAQPDHGIWSDAGNRFRRVGEIYSLWNSRFLLQPGDEPQRFELGIDNRWSYQYAWHRGHRIGVIGSTDNHTGHPGADNRTVDSQHAGGLAAVWAKSNDRGPLWDAIQQRRTYATTGTRILLEFTADGHWMGEEYTTSAPPSLEVKVAGTNMIRSVELVKYDGTKYETIRSEHPEAEVCVFGHVDGEFAGDSMYYVRVTQVDEQYRSPWSKTTSEMAWSSPIWVTRAKPE